MIRLLHIKKINRLGVLFAMVLIRSYQLIASPIFGRTCRFEPSCSHYALTAIDRYGLRKGSGLAIKRLLRCQPWHPGGFDPVP